MNFWVYKTIICRFAPSRKHPSWFIIAQQKMWVSNYLKYLLTNTLRRNIINGQIKSGVKCSLPTYPMICGNCLLGCCFPILTAISHVSVSYELRRSYTSMFVTQILIFSLMLKLLKFRKCCLHSFVHVYVQFGAFSRCPFTS